MTDRDNTKLKTKQILSIIFMILMVTSMLPALAETNHQDEANILFDKVNTIEGDNGMDSGMSSIVSQSEIAQSSVSKAESAKIGQSESARSENIGLVSMGTGYGKNPYQLEAQSVSTMYANLPTGWVDNPEMGVIGKHDPIYSNLEVHDTIWNARNAIESEYLRDMDLMASTLEWVPSDHIFRYNVQNTACESVDPAVLANCQEEYKYARYHYKEDDTNEALFRAEFEDMPGYTGWEYNPLTFAPIVLNQDYETRVGVPLICGLDQCEGTSIVLNPVATVAMGYNKIVEHRWGAYLTGLVVSDIHVAWNGIHGAEVPFYYYDSTDFTIEDASVTRISIEISLEYDENVYLSAAKSINYWEYAYHPENFHLDDVGAIVLLEYTTGVTYEPFWTADQFPVDTNGDALPSPSVVLYKDVAAPVQRSSGYHPVGWNTYVAAEKVNEPVDGRTLGWRLSDAYNWIIGDWREKEGSSYGFQMSNVQWHFGPAYFDYEYQEIIMEEGSWNEYGIKQVRVMVSYVASNAESQAFIDDNSEMAHDGFITQGSAPNDEWEATISKGFSGIPSGFYPDDWVRGVKKKQRLVVQGFENINPVESYAAAEAVVSVDQGNRKAMGETVTHVKVTINVAAGSGTFSYISQSVACRTKSPTFKGCVETTWYLDFVMNIAELLLYLLTIEILDTESRFWKKYEGEYYPHPMIYNDQDIWKEIVETAATIIVEFTKAEWIEGAKKAEATVVNVLTDTNLIDDAIASIVSIWQGMAGYISKTALKWEDRATGGIFYFLYTDYHNQWDAIEPHGPISRYEITYLTNTGETDFINEVADSGTGGGTWWDDNGETVIIVAVIVVVVVAVVACWYSGICAGLTAIGAAAPYAQKSIGLSSVSTHGAPMTLIPASGTYAEDLDNDGLSATLEAEFGTSTLNSDTDGDGMSDSWEVAYGLNPLSNLDAQYDLDGDGVSNILEYGYNSNPDDDDSDGDGMPDSWEHLYGLDLNDATDATQSADTDTLTNLEEYQIGTNPTTAHSDSDLMPDDWEVLYGLDPLFDDGGLDLDSDNVDNVIEYNYGSDPRISNSDLDDISDYDEIYCTIRGYCTDPALFDTDGDGLWDDDEQLYKLTNPLLKDSDYDTIWDSEELVAGNDGYITDPNNDDTDGDGLKDNDEISSSNGYVTDPTDWDSDNDGLSDGAEISSSNGSVTNPNIADTDNDGWSDGFEVNTVGSNPLMMNTVTNGYETGEPPEDATYAHYAIGDRSMSSEKYGSWGYYMSGGITTYNTMLFNYEVKDGYAQSWIKVVSNTWQTTGMWIRATDSGAGIPNGYFARMYRDTLTLYRATNGGLNQLLAYNVGQMFQGSWWHLKMEAVGDILKIWISFDVNHPEAAKITYDISNDATKYYQGKVGFNHRGHATSPTIYGSSYFDDLEVVGYDMQGYEYNFDGSKTSDWEVILSAGCTISEGSDGLEMRYVGGQASGQYLTAGYKKSIGPGVTSISVDYNWNVADGKMAYFQIWGENALGQGTFWVSGYYDAWSGSTHRVYTRGYNADGSQYTQDMMSYYGEQYDEGYGTITIVFNADGSVTLTVDGVMDISNTYSGMSETTKVQLYTQFHTTYWSASTYMRVTSYTEST